MKIVVDAMCAEYGGIRTYVEHLLGGWADAFPDDEVHAVLRQGSTLPTPGLVRHEMAIRGPETLGRPLAQATAMHKLVQRLRPNCVLATAPTTNIRRMAASLGVVILDLRSELRPEQFTLGRRLLRKVSYGRSYYLADGFISISQRSLDDLHRLHPRTRKTPGFVAHLGGDHALGWPLPDRCSPALGFAHHSNKNPRLLLDAWQLLAKRGFDAPALTLVGVKSEARPALESLIEEHHLDGKVLLAPYLPEQEFQRAFAQAALIAFPSDFEGFGLPVIEGMVLGKPVIIGPDPGTLEVAGGHAAVMKGWTPESLADAVEEATAMSREQLEAAQRWASGFSWEETICRTRSALVEIDSRNSARRLRKSP